MTLIWILNKVVLSKSRSIKICAWVKFFFAPAFSNLQVHQTFYNNLEFFNNSRNFLPSLFQYGFSVASVKSSTLDHGDHGLSIESEGWDTFIHVEKMLRATQFGLQKVNHSAVAGKMVLYHCDLKKQDYFCLFFFSKTSIQRGWPHPWEVYLHYSGLDINKPFLKKYQFENIAWFRTKYSATNLTLVLVPNRNRYNWYLW